MYSLHTQEDSSLSNKIAGKPLYYQTLLSSLLKGLGRDFSVTATRATVCLLSFSGVVIFFEKEQRPSACFQPLEGDTVALRRYRFQHYVNSRVKICMIKDLTIPDMM